MSNGLFDPKSLVHFIDRIELLEGEKEAISDDIKDVYAEAKSKGFDAVMIRKVIAARKKSVEEVQGEQELFNTYYASTFVVSDDSD